MILYAVVSNTSAFFGSLRLTYFKRAIVKVEKRWEQVERSLVHKLESIHLLRVLAYINLASNVEIIPNDFVDRIELIVELVRLLTNFVHFELYQLLKSSGLRVNQIEVPSKMSRGADYREDVVGIVVDRMWHSRDVTFY